MRERGAEEEKGVFSLNIILHIFILHLLRQASSITSKATIYDTETISQGRQTAGRIFNNQYP
jgi:hypothetical protein